MIIYRYTTYTTNDDDDDKWQPSSQFKLANSTPMPEVTKEGLQGTTTQPAQPAKSRRAEVTRMAALGMKIFLNNKF
jgi:hypothetical protein